MTYNTLDIALPPGWTDETVVTFAGPWQGNRRPTLLISITEGYPDQPLEHWARAQFGAVVETYSPENVRLRDEGQITVSGFPGYRFLFDCDLPDAQLTVTQLQIYVITRERSYILTATDDVEQFRQSYAAVETALKTFRILR